MKKIGIGLGVFLVFIMSAIGVLTVMASQSDIYKVYPKATAETIKVDSETPIVYYFYQPSCSFCNSNKGSVSQFAKDVKNSEVAFEIVDLTDTKNSAIWYRGTAKNPEVEDPDYKGAFEIQTIEDLKIAGTPSAMYVNKGEVQSIGSASKIYDVFTLAVEEAGLTPTFDTEYKK